MIPKLLSTSPVLEQVIRAPCVIALMRSEAPFPAGDGFCIAPGLLGAVPAVFADRRLVVLCLAALSSVRRWPRQR